MGFIGLGKEKEFSAPACPRRRCCNLIATDTSTPSIEHILGKEDLRMLALYLLRIVDDIGFNGVFGEVRYAF